MASRYTSDVKMNRIYRTPKGTELPLLSLRGRDYLEVKYRLVWFREEHPDWSIETDLVNVTETSAQARATIRDEKGRIIATSHKFENKQGFPDFIEKAETGAIGRALALIGYGTQFCADELDEGERIVDSPVDYTRYHGPRSGAKTSEFAGPSAAVARDETAEQRAARAAERSPMGGGRAGGADAPSASAGEGAPGAVSGAESPDDAPAGVDVVTDPIGSSLQEPSFESGESGTRVAAEGVSAVLGIQGQGQQDQLWNQDRLDPGDYRISFGKKYKGKRLRDIPRHEIESYVEWLESSAERRGVPLSDDARFFKDAVGRYLGESQTH